MKFLSNYVIALFATLFSITNVHAQTPPVVPSPSDTIPKAEKYVTKHSSKIGDKIIKVNDNFNLTGKSISTDDVRKQLRGPANSTVSITVLRNNSQQKQIKIAQLNESALGKRKHFADDFADGFLQIGKTAIGEICSPYRAHDDEITTYQNFLIW